MNRVSPPAAAPVRLVIPARAGLELVAAESAASYAAWCGADEATCGDVRMAVVEACINAIEHGYAGASAESAEIVVTLELDAASRLRIRIADKGRGFDPGSYREPAPIVPLDAARRRRGWGLRLIRGFMDELDLVSDGNGTTLEMTKSLHPGRAEGAR